MHYSYYPNELFLYSQKTNKNHHLSTIHNPHACIVFNKFIAANVRSPICYSALLEYKKGCAYKYTCTAHAEKKKFWIIYMR